MSNAGRATVTKAALTPAISPLPSRHSLTEDVYEAIKTLIMDDVIPPESRVSIDQLARDLGVSSTPIREALVRLEAESLVQKEQLRGYSTTPLLTLAQADELFEFRSVIEPWMAARAAERRDADGVARLQAEMKTLAESPTGEGYRAFRELANQDDRFHQLIAELSGNNDFRQALARTHSHLRLFRLHYTTDRGAASLAEHRMIASAISAGDAAAASEAMRAHLSHARQRVADSLNRRASAE